NSSSLQVALAKFTDTGIVFFECCFFDKIISNLKSIILTCHKKGIPVLWTQHGHMDVELDGGALARWTELNSFLISLSIKTLIISGVKTNLCCETTSRNDGNDDANNNFIEAFDENHDIVFLEDATAVDTKEMHEAALLNIGYGWGIVTTVNNTTK
ncbi:5345_t:CDS:2, partial [Racocetra persica]